MEAYFSTEQMRALWGNLRTRNAVVKDFFIVIQGGKQQKKTNSYEPYTELHDPLIAYLRDIAPVALTKDGKKLSLPITPIASRTAFGNPEKLSLRNSVWTGIRPAALVPINEAALMRLVDEPCSWWERMDAFRLLRLSRNTRWPGMIPVHYVQVKTGRIVDKLFYLQNTSRAALSAALSGYWDYDIENAHFSILYHWAKSIGVETPHIGLYIRGKAEFRQTISADCGIDIQNTKAALIGLMYGAKLEGGYHYSSLSAYMRPDSYELFKRHELVVGLSKDRKTAANAILPTLPVHRGLVGNAIGIYSPTSPNKNVLLAFALQGVEALALRAVIQRFGDQIILPMHDGWVSRQRLDVVEIESVLREATGLPLTVEESQHPKHLPSTSPEEAYRTVSRTFSNNRGGLVLTLSPQWSLPRGITGVETRTDLPG
jgi:hypothetical protein